MSKIQCPTLESRPEDLDGTGVDDLVVNLGELDAIELEVAGGKIYWVGVSTHKVQRANLDGTGVEDLVTGLGNPGGIALDLGGLIAYWPGDGSPVDVVGGHDGVLTNGATFAPGHVGDAFALDGIDDYVEVGSSPA